VNQILFNNLEGKGVTKDEDDDGGIEFDHSAPVGAAGGAGAAKTSEEEDEDIDIDDI